MSEWPQYATVKTRKKLRETILVSPHDLTKELYEALKRWENADSQGDDSTEKALRRYEKEVGK